MADIKLYGKIHNQDGNLLISPFEVAGVNDNGVAYDGPVTSYNNIVSYINEKIKGVNTNVGNIKTGIKSVNVSGTLSPKKQYATITVIGNDGTEKAATLDIDGSKIVKNITINNRTTGALPFGEKHALAYLSIEHWGDKFDTTIDIELPDNDAVGEAWNQSTTATNYKQSVTSAINTAKSEANEYTDTQINAKLGKVYKPQGNATLTTIVTINPKNSVGNVWNMTEKFMIDGEVYPKYTNIVIVDSKNLPTTLEYNTKTGFSGEVVDALGGMFDQTAIQNDINSKFNKSVIGISTPSTAVQFNPITGGDITQSITYTLGDKSTGSFDVKLRCNAIAYAGTDAPGVVIIGDNINVLDGTISVPIATKYMRGVVMASTGSPISIDVSGDLDIKLAADSGINKSANGELSIIKNTFSEGTGININKIGNDFAIGFKTTYISNTDTSTGIPLYYNTNLNGFYINGSDYLDVSTNPSDKATQLSINIERLKSGLNLSSKADNSALQALTSRVEALESLLSLG